MYFGQWSSTGAIWQCLEISAVVTALGREVLLASSGRRPGMLFSILQCPVQAPQQRAVGSTMPTAPRFSSLVWAFRLCI